MRCAKCARDLYHPEKRSGALLEHEGGKRHTRLERELDFTQKLPNSHEQTMFGR